jgi:lysophospholipase L1-like esterase
MTFHRYVALGDSFTEGVGDPDPGRPNGLRGWADRVAEVLAAQSRDFSYANLAIRGRKLPQILEEQVEPALALAPDLVTIHAGTNDLLRPKVDIDDLWRRYDEAISRLTRSGASVVMFTVGDPGAGRLSAPLRGRWAIYNEFLREIADTRGALLVDMWRWRGLPTSAILDVDRLHLNPHGHRLIAGKVLDVLGVPNDLASAPVPQVAAPTRLEDLQWAREWALPWVHRRLTGKSSGDGLAPKRPGLAPISPA